MYTGNLAYIKSYYPTLLSVLDNYYVRHTDKATSLLLREEGYGDYAFIPRDGSAAYYSALYVLALKRAADLAEHLDKGRDAIRWRHRASAVSASFVNILWDPQVGAFFDRRCDGAGCQAHAQDGNSLAILSGIANASRAASALRYLSDANARPYGNAFYDAAGSALGEGFPDRVYPFISYFEIAARFRAMGGRAAAAAAAASALDQIRRTYGWMSARDPGSTFWEAIGTGGARYEAAFTSLAHGWSTGVTPLLTTFFIGAAPTAPGFAEWDVRPVPGDVAWARGEVPTPRGPLRVSWERRRDAEGGDGLEITVSGPKGTKGTVRVPAAEGDEDGTKALLDDGYIAFEVRGGEEHVVGYPQP